MRSRDEIVEPLGGDIAPEVTARDREVAGGHAIEAPELDDVVGAEARHASACCAHELAEQRPACATILNEAVDRHAANVPRR
jgi:hypothetical protein